jgi:type IV pilus assembly protein PilM
MPPSKATVTDCVALVIESTDVRYLSIRKGQVQTWGSVPLPPGLVADGLVTNAVETGRLIDQLFTSEKLSRGRVLSAIPGLRAIPRLLTLPKLQASMMEAAISREAKKEMPVSLENLYLSWQTMPGSGDQQRIYLLGVPRDLVDAQHRALQAAGVVLSSLDLKPLALVRAVNKPQAVIVNLEQDSLDIILVVDHLPAIMRTFLLSAGLAAPKAKMDRLLTEMSQTLRFYNDSHINAPISASTPVCVTGRLLNNREALDYFRSASDRPLELPLAPIPCPDDLPVAEYMTNLGLAAKKP